MSTPNYGFLRDRPEPKKAEMKSQTSNRSQRFKNYPRPVIAEPEPLTPEVQADITRKFKGMVEILLTYNTKLSLAAAEARVRAVLHTTYPNLGELEGAEEAPVEEMFRFNEVEDVKVVARMVEEEKRLEMEREENMKRAAEVEKEWVLVEKKKKNRKELAALMELGSNTLGVTARTRASSMQGMMRMRSGAREAAVLRVVRNGTGRGGLRVRGSFESVGSGGRDFGGRGRGGMQ